MVRQEKGDCPVHLSEMQAYVRVETGDEEALLAGLLRSATEMCEAFINQPLLARGFTQSLRLHEGWTVVGVQPVRSMTFVRDEAGEADLDRASYRLDIDHEGKAFISGLPAGTKVMVGGTAGLATDGNGIPEPLRQGIMILAASLYAHRDEPKGALPTAVTSLWRPFRRAGLCR